jgi:hypothetical protein
MLVVEAEVQIALEGTEIRNKIPAEAVGEGCRIGTTIGRENRLQSDAFGLLRCFRRRYVLRSDRFHDTEGTHTGILGKARAGS